MLVAPAQELSSMMDELLLGCREVVVAADVEPASLERHRPHLFACADELEQEIWHVEPLAGTDALEHVRRESVDAHAHVARGFGLLDVAYDAIAVGLDDAEVDRVRAPKRRHARGGAGLDMIREERSVVEGGEDVAVHHEKRLVEVADGGQRPGRAQRSVLTRVADLHVEASSIAEVGLDELGKVADGQRDLLEPPPHKLANDDLEYRGFAERHERLRKHQRVWRKPCPLAAGKYDCLPRQ